MKAPDWTGWIKSEEGKRCSTISTLRAANVSEKQADGYLENRLWAAFIAGAKYEREKAEENPIDRTRE